MYVEKTHENTQSDLVIYNPTSSYVKVLETSRPSGPLQRAQKGFGKLVASETDSQMPIVSPSPTPQRLLFCSRFHYMLVMITLKIR